MTEQPYIEADWIPEPLRPVVKALCRVGSELSVQIARGPLQERLGAELGSNTDGDTQKALDVIADNAFARALRGAGVRYYASEERETVDEIDPTGTYALAIDPLDGSSNIDVNVSIGTIFSVYEAKEGAEESFLRDTDEQIAAGYL
ncbi:MAG: fructose-bisphosphatase class I, partial [Thalassovita sp.]|nr:fructose-bisphosphatase class I [Thalassovita sp.]